jgi:hypothetical protein
VVRGSRLLRSEVEAQLGHPFGIVAQPAPCEKSHHVVLSRLSEREAIQREQLLELLPPDHVPAQRIREDMALDVARPREHPVRVQIIGALGASRTGRREEYTLGKDPGRPAQPAPIRLLTTILDPTRAPATELAALYQQRWEFETTLDELKTHQRGPKVVLRSKSPEMVAQEVWGMLLVHHAIRRLMHQTALDYHLDPDRLSFVRSLRVVRRQVSTTGQAAVPP